MRPSALSGVTPSWLILVRWLHPHLYTPGLLLQSPLLSTRGWARTPGLPSGCGPAAAPHFHSPPPPRRPGLYTWGVDEKTLDQVFLPPVSQNAAEKMKGEAATSAHRKTLAPQLKHGRHVAPGLVGNGSLKQKLGWSVRDIQQRRPFQTQSGNTDKEEEKQARDSSRTTYPSVGSHTKILGKLGTLGHEVVGKVVSQETRST